MFRSLMTIIKELYLYVTKVIQYAAERTPLFEKRINSKPKEIRKYFSIMESTQNAVLINLF